jgi:trans-aconitate 2-methyltransferase
MTAKPAEWNAQSYHKVSTPHMTWGAAVLARLDLRGDETVIDVGCGTGRLTAEVLERLPAGSMIALDRSRNMLDQAEAYLGPRFGDRVTYVEADLTKVEPGDIAHDLDLVFSTATFHWLPDHDRLFRWIHSILKPHGWLIAQCGGGPNLARLRARLADLIASPRFAAYFEGWPGPWHFANDVDTAERLARAGFDSIETGLISAPAVMPDAAAYREFIETVVFSQHLIRLPVAAARNAFLDTLTDQAATEETPFELDYWRLNIKARRA